MNNKEMAMRQIDEIYTILYNNIKTVISGTKMIAIGIGVMLIPIIELILSHTIDPFLSKFNAAVIFIFMIRSIFYWVIFYGIGKYFKSTNTTTHLIINKVFAVGKILPIIGLFLSAALGYIGHSNLIAPILLILVGCFFMFYGQFTLRIVTISAIILIVAGIIGILLTSCNIMHLWQYLIAFEGITLILMGVILNNSNPTITQ